MSMEQFERIRQELETCPQITVVKPSDLLMLPRILRTVLNQAFRVGKISTYEMAHGLELDTSEVETIAGILVQKGYLQKPSNDEPDVYTARFGGVSSRSGGNLLDKL